VKIAATQSALLALNYDGTIWVNRQQGKDRNWLKIGDINEVREIAAANVGQSSELKIAVLKNNRRRIEIATFRRISDNNPADYAKRVDLRSKQTPLKNQGGRTTCISFAAIAAIEAAYKRAGYGDLDLSEEFLNYFHKSFYLHPKWNDIVRKGNDPPENQLGFTGGGGGVGRLKHSRDGLLIPLEQKMPYRTSSYPNGTDSRGNIFPSYRDYRRQKQVNGFNLHPANVNPNVYNAGQYYGVRSMVEINPKDTAKIEAVLKKGFEVVWDFSGADRRGSRNNTPIWLPKQPGESNIAHSMLIVGFDKRDRDAKKHYFIAKNTWGPTTVRGADGFTLVSYGYVKESGTAAAYVTKIRPRSSWREMGFVGRWKLDFDGHKGTLDIYHLPGLNKHVFQDSGIRGITDRRIGVFYDRLGKAFHVNGSIRGNKIIFYFDGRKPVLRWDKLSGRRFEYYLNDRCNFMAGFHTDPGSREKYAGYAVRVKPVPGNPDSNTIIGTYLPAGNRTPRPFSKQSFHNSFWKVNVADRLIGTLNIANRSGRMVAQFRDDRTRRTLTTRIVSFLGGNRFTIYIGTYKLLVQHLNHEPGVMAGYEIVKRQPVYLTRK
jgi:hypothetical protein